MTTPWPRASPAAKTGADLQKIYTTRENTRSDVFDYIEMFYNSKRRHGFNNQLSLVDFEKRYTASLESV